jgi:hypothetical protein
VHYFVGLQAYFLLKMALFDMLWLSTVFEESLLVGFELRHEASRANAVHLLIFPQLIRRLSAVCPELGLFCLCFVREQAEGRGTAA